tara:strand:+ start:367 stop:1410 length:1044 start_codon:yes stop_codon:yes gene_type:complete
LITHYPPGFLRGLLHDSVNTGWYQPNYLNVLCEDPSDRIGVLDWDQCFGPNWVEGDYHHFVDYCDHVVVISTEHFWPDHLKSKAHAQYLLDCLGEYSIIYHDSSHSEVEELGVHSTWQPWFCRMACTEYTDVVGDKDYDFACLLGRRSLTRDSVADFLQDYNCLTNYFGRDNTVLDWDFTHANTREQHDTPIPYEDDMHSELYRAGDTLDRTNLPPVSVYDVSHMDLIHESHPKEPHNNQQSVLLSEKTARSLAHGRLFRTLGHKGYLGELIRCGLSPLPIWRSDHDTGTQQDCFDSFCSDVAEYSGNDFAMMYDECRGEIAHNQEIYRYLCRNYPNIIHKHFELIK